MSYAPYKFKETNLILDKDRKDCYFLVEFYFLVGFLEKKLPLEIVQFIFAIVKEKQENLRALHVASWAYQKTIHSVLDEYRHEYYKYRDEYYEYRYIYLGPMDRWGHMRNNDHLNCLKYSDEVSHAEAEVAAKAEAKAEAKKNKKLWVKKKKEKLLEYKNRGLKR